MPLVSCPRGAWSLVGSNLYVGGRAYSILSTPAGVADLYEAIFAASGLRCRPRLVWLRDAGGAGGFYGGGLVAVGERDLAGMSATVVNRYMQEASPFGGATFYTRDFIWWETVRVVLAHELGHARQDQEREPMYGILAEANADGFAGRIAHVLGWDSSIDRIVLHSLGCMGDARLCTHPRPDGRVEAYDAHRRAEREAQQQVAFDARVREVGEMMLGRRRSGWPGWLYA